MHMQEERMGTLVIATSNLGKLDDRRCRRPTKTAGPLQPMQKPKRRITQNI